MELATLICINFQSQDYWYTVGPCVKWLGMQGLTHPVS